MAIYFIKCRNWVKIGRATNVRTRFNQIQCHSPFEMVLLGQFPGGYQEERALHWRFKGLRGKGEWFLIDGPLEDLISRMSRDKNSEAEVRSEIAGFKRFLPTNNGYLSA